MPAQTPLPKYKLIAQDIEHLIKSGQLHEGDALPSINAYASQHNVNRSTVKRAYDSLADVGLILSEQGRGYFVISGNPTFFPESSEMRCFWSYSHKDDDHCGGAITKLRESIQAEYEFQTGSKANIFQDTKDIAWGANWRTEIARSLGVTTFFIPILTPTYLRSPQCLAELRQAKIRFDDIGFPEGIYPIEFVDCTRTLERFTDDGLATLLQDTQRNRNWIGLRLEDPSSAIYKKGVADIVDALLQKEDVWNRAVQKAADEDTGFFEDTEEGLLEKIAAIQDATGELESVMRDITTDLNDIGHAFNSTKQSERDSNPRQALVYAAVIGRKLEEPSAHLQEHCASYNKLILEMDRGIDGIAELNNLIRESAYGSPEGLNLESLRAQIRDMVADTDEPFRQMSDVRDVLRNFARIARALKAPCSRIDSALDLLESSKEVFISWEQKLQ